jgi:hypothetical protein
MLLIRNNRRAENRPVVHQKTTRYLGADGRRAWLRRRKERRAFGRFGAIRRESVNCRETNTRWRRCDEMLSCRLKLANRAIVAIVSVAAGLRCIDLHLPYAARALWERVG